jgi:hypothetical protein
MYPFVGPWRAALVKLGLNTAVIEAEIVADGAMTAAAIVKRGIDRRSVNKKQAGQGDRSDPEVRRQCNLE